MRKQDISAMCQQINLALSTSAESFPLALMCASFQEAEILNLLTEKGYKVICLDGHSQKHILKRKLNEEHCEIILYTRDFDSMIYEIFNDGTTLLNEAILLDEYL